MPIIGRTTEPENGIGRLQVIGRLWKGEPKSNNTAGKDLGDRFRFEAPDGIREQFEHIYGDSFPDNLRIYLPYGHVHDCFDTWNEEYSAQGFKKRCNGDRIIQEMQPVQIGKTKHWQRVDVDKPCDRGDAPICGDCKAQGRFFFYIQELYSAGMGSTKCFMMTVTGIHDIIGFTDQLRGLQQKYGSLHASPVPSPFTHGYIPYVLTRIEKTISRPNGEARARGKAWVLSISEDPEWLAVMQKWDQYHQVQRLMEQPEEMRSLLLPAMKQTHLALPAIMPTTVESPLVIDNGRTSIYLKIDGHMKRLGWGRAKTVKLLKSLYPDKATRDELSDGELADFTQAIASQKIELNPEPIQPELVTTPTLHTKPLN